MRRSGRSRGARKKRSNPLPPGFPDAITKPTDGFNCVSGFAEFFSQPANVGIDRAGVDHAFITPDLVEQAVAFLDASLPPHQHAEELELDTRQPHRFARDLDVVPGRIERDQAYRYFVFLGPVALAAAQNRIYSQDQFAWTERFRDVIIRAEFEPDDAVDLLRF